MYNIFLESDYLILEPLEEKHLTIEYVSWLNDKDVVKFNSHGVFPNNFEKTKEYIKNIQFNDKNIVLAVIEKSTNKHIGNSAIQNIDFINSNADLSILIGDKSKWGKGYGYDVFRLLISHCFMQLNLHKVTSGTTDDNIAMQKVFEKLEMSKESVLKEQIKRNNSFYDIYTYGLLNNQWKSCEN